MSRKSFFKGFGKKVSLAPAEKVQRKLDEIKKEYDQAAYESGQIQYLMYAKQLELETVNKRLLALNQEYHAANKVEKVATQAIAQEGVSNEQAK